MKPWLLSLVPLMLPCSAMAHATLEHAEPGAGAGLTSAPGQVRLEFNEPLEAAFSGVSVTDPSGQSAVAGAATITGTTMTVRLKAAVPGEYRVQWHAVSVDTHRSEGSYSFTVDR